MTHKRKLCREAADQGAPAKLEPVRPLAESPLHAKPQAGRQARKAASRKTAARKSAARKTTGRKIGKSQNGSPKEGGKSQDGDPRDSHSQDSRAEEGRAERRELARRRRENGTSMPPASEAATEEFREDMPGQELPPKSRDQGQPFPSTQSKRSWTQSAGPVNDRLALAFT